jgi:hypothetical protein
MQKEDRWNTSAIVSMGKILGAQGYAGMHMEKFEHAYNVHIGSL